MSLPQGFLDELRDRLSIADVVGRKVAWDARRSNPGRGDYWAPCPFHQEKTASFHVDERKGFYYCFGCHAKGDAIGFVRETENIGFIEAVRMLAEEAGMALPEADPGERARSDRRGRLVEVMEQAVRLYRRQLASASGGRARAYLERRGLDADAVARFEIGYAADDRQGLWRALTGAGVAPEAIEAAGLAARPDDGGAPYDRFRDRVMFPIRDAQGRAIAFGGRALSPEARAKYLNSPQTELFDKSRTLFNLGPAREAAGRGAPLIVAEGYMDVVALVGAGFPAAVAPLGTAVTAPQLSLLWRAAEEPVIALDGDRAGLTAAIRVIDVALPVMQAGQGLRFCLLPEGRDPDDLIRERGAPAMAELIEGSVPMIDLIWRRETDGRLLDSPERHAALEKRLLIAAGRITDQGLQRAYREAFRDRLWRLRRGAGPHGGRGGDGPRRSGSPRRVQPAAPTLRSALASKAADAPERLREAAILAVLAANPAILERFEDDLHRLRMSTPDHARLREALIDCAGLPVAEIPGRLVELVGREALDAHLSQTHLALIPAVRSPGDDDLAALSVAEDVAKLDAHRGLAREVDEAIEDMGGQADERLTWRLAEASAAHRRAERAMAEDRAAYDLGPNGVKLNRSERAAFDALLRQISHTRAPRT